MHSPILDIVFVLDAFGIRSGCDFSRRLAACVVGAVSSPPPFVLMQHISSILSHATVWLPFAFSEQFCARGYAEDTVPTKFALVLGSLAFFFIFQTRNLPQINYLCKNKTI